MMSLAAKLGDDLDLGSGRLDHLDSRFGAVVGDAEVLGPHAVDRWPAVAVARRRASGKRDAAGAFELGAAIGAEPCRSGNSSPASR